MTFRNGLFSGLFAGIMWGWLSMAANSFTGVTELEGSFAHNIVSFTFAGGVFGIVAGGLFAILNDFLPIRSMVAKAVVVTGGLWVLLRVAGALLSKMEPERFHIVTPESVQGFVLSMVLGLAIGIVATRGRGEAELN